VLRLLALGYIGLMLYYLRFFLGVRQELSTLVQIALLVGAVAVLVVPPRVPRVNPLAIAVTALVAAAIVFAWADHDSHSVSDTLTRAVPALCVILSSAVRLVPERTPARG
jgi:hypothetical protein